MPRRNYAPRYDMAVRLQDRIATYWALGPGNVARVAAYRLGLRLGLHPVLYCRGTEAPGPFFDPPSAAPIAGVTARPFDAAHITLFSRHTFPTNGIPDWHVNPFNGARADPTRPWHKIPDFDPRIGDIKTIWEPSRWAWLIPMAQAARQGSAADLLRINDWLADWTAKNPAYLGVNWKCGQEASIRVVHLAATALILGTEQTLCPALRAALTTHLRRIARSTGYAIGQANNHGISEAAALFIGGTWLARAGDRAGARWARQGRRLLENRVDTLIEPDGTFSQYSVIYHRLMLDICSSAELWRRRLSEPEFAPVLYKKCRAATLWLHAMIDPQSGDAPNIGANDGALVIPVSPAGYRDFRPSLDLAARLFCGRAALNDLGPWTEAALWFGLKTRDRPTLPEPGPAHFDQGGFHILRAGSARAILRYPRFRFRPSHADGLHLDFWTDGQNVLRDGGSFSYHSPADDLAHFSGTAAHNTAQFDDRDQMPRLGRFLFARWLRAEDVAWGDNWAAAAYRDGSGAYHHRHVTLRQGRLIVRDRIEGMADHAVIRWRLMPGAYQRAGQIVTGNGLKLRFSVGVDLALTTGQESRYYLDKSPLPVVEARISGDAEAKTEIVFGRDACNRDKSAARGAKMPRDADRVDL